MSCISSSRYNIIKELIMTKGGISHLHCSNHDQFCHLNCTEKNKLTPLLVGKIHAAFLITERCSPPTSHVTLKFMHEHDDSPLYGSPWPPCVNGLNLYSVKTENVEIDACKRGLDLQSMPLDIHVRANWTFALRAVGAVLIVEGSFTAKKAIES